MAVLNSWQKISRVLPGKDFGDEVDTTGTISVDTTFSNTRKSCAGTATSTTLTADTDASPFAVGDVILLHQSRGTGVGQWEINKIASVGSDQYTLSTALNYTYTDSGASQAQAIKVSRYSTLTVNTGVTWSAPAWDGDTGGILVFACKETATITGNLSATTKGFIGGVHNGPGSRPDKCGEGTGGASALQTAANGNGGGGGWTEVDPARAGAGGGGHATSGGSGSSNTGGTPGVGGSSVGSADLTSINFGGAGGAVSKFDSTYNDGGAGAGIIIVFAKDIVLTGTIVTNGGNAVTGGNNGAGAGGGAGGSVLLVNKTATLGTNKITCTAGADAPSGTNNDGGDGSVGRIAVHHSSTITGSSTPTFEDVTDTSLSDMMIGYIHIMN